MGRFLRLLALTCVLAPASAFAEGTATPAPQQPTDASGEQNDTSATPSSPAPADEGATSAVASEPPPRFDERTHFSLSWVRMPGAEDCVSAKQLSRDVESRLRRPALGAPSETDVAIEGFIEKTDAGTFHAVVTIGDSRGKLLGKRELEGAVCRDMDAALALAVALMIDPDAAFAPTAKPVAARPRDVRPSPVVPRAPAVTPPPSWRGNVSLGIAVGFGSLPRTSELAWVLASFEPRHLFPIEFGARLALDQTVRFEDASVTFSRSTLDLGACPLGVHVSVLRLAACAGLEAGTITSAGVGQKGLIEKRRAVVDGALRGHLDLVFARRFFLGIIPSLGIPFIRDSFNYARNDKSLPPVFPVPAVRGEVGVGLGVELP